ncbi:MAG: VanZ family protein [Oceanospirillaceae bacterium]
MSLNKFLNELVASKKFLLINLCCVMVSMLYIGLKDDIPGANQVRLSANDGALVFGVRALAYSRQNLNEQRIDELNSQGFEIKLSFSPRSYEGNSFQFLLLFSNGNPSEQLIVAQFGDHIIAMNGDDYNYSKKQPRISVKIKDPFKGYQNLSLRVEPNATTLTLNNQRSIKKEGQIIKLPHTAAGVRLLLSGSELLEYNWRGAIKFLSIAGIDTPAQELAFIRFVAEPSQLPSINPTLDWLLIPEKLTLLKHRVLDKASFRINSSSTLNDILLNFFGFIPFGLLIAALVMRIPFGLERSLHKGILVLFAAFLCAFLLSFIIEYRQAWLVTRHSSLRDLTLNSLGGAAGAALFISYVKLRKLYLQGNTVKQSEK